LRRPFAIMTGVAYATSAEMAGELGAFEGYKANASAMLRVMRNHARAANGKASGYEALGDRAGPADHAALKDKALGDHARNAGARGRARRPSWLSQRAGERCRTRPALSAL